MANHDAGWYRAQQSDADYLTDGLLDGRITNILPLKLASSNFTQSIGWPLQEPVYVCTVDQTCRAKLCSGLPEHLTALDFSMLIGRAGKCVSKREYCGGWLPWASLS